MKARCDDAFCEWELVDIGVVSIALRIIQRYIPACTTSGESVKRSSVPVDAVAFPFIKDTQDLGLFIGG